MLVPGLRGTRGDGRGESRGVVAGRRLDDGSRFIANTADDPALLAEMEANDYLGSKGRVTNTDGQNTFVPG